MHVQCCVCGRVRSGERWASPRAPLPGSVSHGFCPECYRRAMAELDTVFVGSHPGAPTSDVRSRHAM